MYHGKVLVYCIWEKTVLKKIQKKITKSKKAIKIKIWNLNVLCTIVMHV
jgi:hypothetical protein